MRETEEKKQLLKRTGEQGKRWLTKPERLDRRNENGDLDYDFTVEDETVWSRSWSGRYTWKSSDSKVYEYACHEGNYSMGNILRGARLLEQEWEPPNSLASGAE